jgi:putative ABC transport system substrate-binding protein
MDRRRFIVAFGVLIAPLVVRAQHERRVYTIGLLRVGVVPLSRSFWDAMREFGWVERQNVKIEARYAERDDQLPALAAELVGLNVDVIMTSGTPAAQAAKRATNTIPIVFTLGGDPVERGLVASLARPGANLTGFVVGLYEDKLLQILKEALPGVSRVAYPVSAFQDPNSALLPAANALGVQVLNIAVQRPEDFGPFFATARRAGAGAVLIPNVSWFVPILERLASESVKSRLPAFGYRRIFADSGGLLSYGPTLQAESRVAGQVDKILKGAKPGELPVEQPTKFELVINLKTAKALGLTIPQSLLLRADEVIQ